MTPSSKASLTRAQESAQHKFPQFLQFANFLVLGLTTGFPSDPCFVWRMSSASQCSPQQSSIKQIASKLQKQCVCKNNQYCTSQIAFNTKQPCNSVLLVSSAYHSSSIKQIASEAECFQNKRYCPI